MSALFRLSEPDEGFILVDGECVAAAEEEHQAVLLHDADHGEVAIKVQAYFILPGFRESGSPASLVVDHSTGSHRVRGHPQGQYGPTRKVQRRADLAGAGEGAKRVGWLRKASYHQATSFPGRATPMVSFAALRPVQPPSQRRPRRSVPGTTAAAVPGPRYLGRRQGRHHGRSHC